MIYKTCSYCGANLDPGERCDCGDIKDNLPESRLSKRENYYTLQVYHKQQLPSTTRERLGANDN